jgi:CRP-like cAMP-binding protein
VGREPGLKIIQNILKTKKQVKIPQCPKTAIFRVPIEALYKYFSKFSPLSGEAMKAISGISSLVLIRKNQDLQPIGHTCKTIYFLKKGVARIYYYKEDIDITESFSFENNIVVRFESLFAGRPSKKGIQAIEDSEFIAINAPQLFKLYDKFPEIEHLFRKITESQLVENINRVESIQFNTAEERYNSLIREAPDVLKRVPLKYVASYLGITPVSLSRIRGQR